MKVVHGGSHDSTNIKQIRNAILVVLRHCLTRACSLSELVSSFTVGWRLGCLIMFLSTCPFAVGWQVCVLSILLSA